MLSRSGCSLVTRVTTLAGLVLGMSVAVVATAPSSLATVDTTVPCSGSGGGPAGLVAAVTAANSGGGGTVTLAAGCTYTFASAASSANNGTAVPSITAAVTIAGNGAVLTRSTAAGTPTFRAFLVGGGNLTLKDLTVQGFAVPSSGGAALWTNSGSATLSRVLLAGNSTTGNGGAIRNNGTTTISDSTLANNTVSSPGAVGGAVSNGQGAVTIRRSTITGNTAPGAAGLDMFSTTTISGSVIAGNDGADCGRGTPSDGGYNVAGDATCGFTASTSKNNQGSAYLTPLADHGGLSRTVAGSRAGSPLLNAAGSAVCSTAPNTDQRGASRPSSTCDIGAFQHASTAVVTTASPSTPTAYGSPVTLTARLYRLADTTPSGPFTGSLSFTAQGVTVGSAALTTSTTCPSYQGMTKCGVATVSATTIPAGNNTINVVVTSPTDGAPSPALGSYAKHTVTAPTYTLTTCNAVDLVNAVANGNTANGASIALKPNCTYTLAAADSTADGASGLTAKAPLIISGSNDIITRSSGAPAMRLLTTGTPQISTSTSSVSMQGVSLVAGVGPTAASVYAAHGPIALKNGTVYGASGAPAVVAAAGRSYSLTRVTVAGNASGGVSGPGTITSSTIARNAGVGVGAGATLAGTLVAGNSSSNCSGAVTDAGYNATDTAACGFSATGSVVSAALTAALGTLGDYGGGSFTVPHGPDAARDAIPTANALCAGLDQRGVTLPKGAGCDIGATEAVASTTTSVTATPDRVEGDTTVLTATLTGVGDPAGATPLSGTAQFLIDSQPVGASVAVVNGVATVTVTAPDAGAHVTTVQYSGDKLRLAGTTGSASWTTASSLVGCAGTTGDVAGLRAAITRVENNPDGVGRVSLSPGCTYLLADAAFTDADGSNGLPQVTGDLTLRGNGATIARDTTVGTPRFRLLEVTGSLAADHLTLTGGSAGAGHGGAVLVLGTLDLDHSTVRANSARAGGGLYLSGRTTVRNSTLDGNSAPDGAAVLSAAGDPVAIVATTVSASKASAAVHDVAGTLTLTADLLAANSAGDCATAVGDGGYNVAAGETCAFTAPASQNSAPALTADLAPLRNRGGKVFTRGLLPGSPAVDRIPAGVTDIDGVALCGPSSTDARDVVRNQAPACAAGAFEPMTVPSFQVVNAEPFDAYPSRQPHDVTVSAQSSAGFPTPTGAAHLLEVFSDSLLPGGDVNEPITVRLATGRHSLVATYDGDANYRPVTNPSSQRWLILVPYGTITVPCDVHALQSAGLDTTALAGATTDDGLRHNDTVKLASGCSYTLGSFDAVSFAAADVVGNGATIDSSQASAVTLGASGLRASISDVSLVGGTHAALALRGSGTLVQRSVLRDSEYGVLDLATGDVSVTDTTFSGNSVAIFAPGGSNATFAADTFVDNGTTFAGFSSRAVKQSVLADADCGSGVVDGGGNLLLSGSCPGVTLSATSEEVDNLDATLSPLGDHGGLVPTVALLPDSPAIDWVTGDCDATDARGVPRPQGAACDAGAFEVAPTTTTLTGPASVPRGTLARFHVGVSADGGSLGPPVGTVTLYDGATLLKTVAVSGATRSVSFRLRGRGVHTITAAYNGSDAYPASSTTLDVTVTRS